MSELQIFENSEFGNIRTVEENGKVLFCGSDVAKALGYSNAPDALNRHCRSIVKRDTATAQGNLSNMAFVSEGDVYRLITHSKLPAAERFERWVFDEVLPSIRSHGMYATPETVERLLNDPDTMIITLQTLKAEREQRKALEAKVQHDQPKVLFAEAVESSHTSILVGDLAKLIRQNGVDIGQKRLFDWMREHGFLMKNGESRNMPSQRAMEMGLFEVKETTIISPNDTVRTTKTTKVTGKGQLYFINRFLSDKEKRA